MPSRLEGTPWHITYLKTNDERRHKARCKYYSKQNVCKIGSKCIGSSHCSSYKEVKKENRKENAGKKQNKVGNKGNRKRALDKESSTIKINNKDKIKSRQLLDEKISLGSLVILKNISDNEEILINIVDECDKNIMDGKITRDSPIGKLIIGKEKGDIVKVNEDTDYEVSYRIMEFDK